ncbi:GM17691 [Drosophila sechellia]|uniref:GM17691 n=1 Tax=Drosophila sechellia TaxID=7238 RepID=B4ILI6_DROSE|nr:GM17691 [Drosophila sechellia]
MRDSAAHASPAAAATQKWIVCRVCLQQPKEPMASIFNDDSEKDLTHMIRECGGVPIKQFDHYPDKICEKCFKVLKMSFKFRETCQRSYGHLRQFVGPVEVYDVYETYEGDLIPDQGYDHEMADQALSELSAEIEYLDQVEHDQLTESAHEDDADVDLNSTEEEFVPSKSVRASINARIATKRRVNPRRSATSTASAAMESGTSKTADRGNPLKIRRGNSDSVGSKMGVKSEKDISIGEVLARKHAGIKTKGGHKILVGDKKEFKYICDVCGNMYPSQSRLTEHIKVHSGVKPHECEICGHCFAQAQQLARHMNTHTGNRPYKCSYCPAAFADLSTRNKHHRIHTNERPYECDVCHKTFTYTNTLKFHKMIHTGEKPHVCDVCGKGFPQAYKLRNHRVIHERRGQSARESVPGLLPYDTANIVGLDM